LQKPVIPRLGQYIITILRLRRVGTNETNIDCISQNYSTIIKNKYLAIIFLMKSKGFNIRFQGDNE
jgi:hypothetical protein